MDEGIHSSSVTSWSVDRRTDEENLEAWRWRSYTAHLADLGYDLHGGGPPDEGLDEAIAGYRERGEGR